MQIEHKSFLKKVDINFALVVLILNFIGLLNLYSATHTQDSTSLSHFFVSQLIWLGAGWVLYIYVTFIDYKIFHKIAYAIYGLNILFLLLVPFIGKSFYGAQRWIDLKVFRYQPSETMKIALIFILARILLRYNAHRGMGFKELLLPLAITLLPFLLVAKQPDLGTGLVLIAIAFSMFLFVGVQRKVILTGLATIIIALPLAWSFALKPYQKSRVLTFLDPGRDPRGAGYNSIQSKIAVGSGQVLGKGFRRGTQSQLEFLPERHTDFIFSVLSEEHGFIGSMITVGLFILLFWMSIRIASQARDKFGALLTIGIASYIFWHMFVNIGMVTGLLPIVGMPLPLLSYGGSGTLSTMLGLGLIASVSNRKYLF